MRIRDLIEELKAVEKDYGNLSINRFDSDVDLYIENDNLRVVTPPNRRF